MKTRRVKVIDGPLPPDIWEWPNREPTFVTEPRHLAVLQELLEREPIFHRPEWGTRRVDFERLMDPQFWEVSASGRRFSREFVLAGLEQRYGQPTETEWEVSDPFCQELAPDNYLLAYTLTQGTRVTRRTTIWRRTANGWKIVYHQGTTVLAG